MFTRIFNFSRMLSKSSRFTLGVWGLRVCSLDALLLRSQPFATVRNRSQPSATVRNRSQPSARLLYGRAFCRTEVLFGGFKHLVDSFRVAGVALRDIRMCFVTCRKSFCDCVAGAILLRRFPKMRCSFRGRRCTLDVSIVMLRGRRSIGRVASSGDKADSVAGVAFCEMCWVLRIDGSLARNIDFEVANLEIPKKTRRKTLILRLQSVKIGGSLARNARFAAPTCLVSSLWFSCGLAVSMGEAAKPLLFDGFFQAGCHVVLCGRRGTLSHSNLLDNVSKVSNLAEVSHEMLVLVLPPVSFRVSGFLVASPCLCGKLQKSLLFGCFQAGCHVLLRGRRGTLWHSNLFDNVSKMSKLEAVSHEMLVFLRPCVSSRVSGFPVASPCVWGKLHTLHFTLHTLHFRLLTPHSALCTPHFTLCTLHSHSSLDTLHSTLYTPHFTLYTLHSTLHTLHFTLHTLHFTLYTSHSTLYTPHSTLYTLHSTLYTLHSTLHTPHTTLYTLHAPYSTLSTQHSTFHTLHSTLYTSHSTLYIPHSSLHTPHSTRHTLHFPFHTPHTTLYTPHSTLHTQYFTLHTLHFTLLTPHSTLYTLHSTLYTLHSTLYTLHSTIYTLHTPHSWLHILHSTLYTPHSTFHTPHSTLYTPHSKFYTLHSSLYTLHFAFYTPHSTLYTPHFTLHTPHSTLYTLHFTLYTLHFTLYTLHATLDTLHFTLHTFHASLHTSHSTLYTLHSSLHTLHSTLHTLHSTLCTPHSTLYTLHSTLHTLHVTLYTLHFPLHTPHSTLYTLYTPHSTLHTFTLYTHYTPHSTLYTSLSLLYTPHSTLYTPHSTLSTPHCRLVTGEFVQDCSNKLLQTSVVCDCISMCFHICTINLRVSIRVRGLHLVFVPTLLRFPAPNFDQWMCNQMNLCKRCSATFWSHRTTSIKWKLSRKLSWKSRTILKIRTSLWQLASLTICLPKSSKSKWISIFSTILRQHVQFVGVLGAACAGIINMTHQCIDTDVGTLQQVVHDIQITICSWIFSAQITILPLLNHNFRCYPLVNCPITMENHHFSWENPLYITSCSCFFPSKILTFPRTSPFPPAASVPPCGWTLWSCRRRGMIRYANKETRSILHGYFNPLVFWYQWEYLLTSNEFIFLQGS